MKEYTPSLILEEEITWHLRAKDLALVHSNLWLLWKNFPRYNQEETQKFDIRRDGFHLLDDNGILEVANLFLDELKLEFVFFNDDQVASLSNDGYS